MAKSRPVSNAQRQFVAERARWRCEYCQSPELMAPQPFTMEHIIPVVQDGPSEPENLAYACQGCNGSKYDKTQAFDPITKQEVPLFNPRTQRWSEHFSWDKTSTLIIGLTPTGRATVIALKLNRKRLIALRETLLTFGMHPPKND